jgi:hypothetical protein
MLYTTDGYNYADYVVEADEPHYNLYFKLSILYSVLKSLNMEDKIGVYLGITNQSFMGADNRISVRGQDAGKGYDGLVTQALIAKHFGCKRITTFILNSVWEGSANMGGVFESYGDDFMDRYNTSLNGPNSLKSFEIAVVAKAGLGDDVIFDFWLNSWMIYFAGGLYLILSYLYFLKVKKSSQLFNGK